MIGAIAAVWLAAAPPATAATPCDLPDLRTAVAASWEATSPLLDEAADAALRSAAGVDAPELRVGVDNLDPDATPPGAAFMLRVPLPAPWVEVAQRSLADAEDDERRAAVAALVAASVGEITEAYGDRLAAATRRQAAQLALDAARALTLQQQRAAAAGWTRTADALSAHEALAHWQHRLDEADAAQAAAEAALLAWVPDLDTTSCAPVTAPPLAPPRWADGGGQARAAVLEARARIARAEGLPWIDAVRATMTVRSGSRPDGGFGLVLRLPWPTGANAEGATLASEAAIARTAEADRQRAADAEYAAATARWRRADDAVRGLLDASPTPPTPSGDAAADAEAQLAWAGLSWWHAEAQASAIEAATAVWALRPP